MGQDNRPDKDRYLVTPKNARTVQLLFHPMLARPLTLFHPCSINIEQSILQFVSFYREKLKRYFIPDEIENRYFFLCFIFHKSQNRYQN